MQDMTDLLNCFLFLQISFRLQHLTLWKSLPGHTGFIAAKLTQFKNDGHRVIKTARL